MALKRSHSSASDDDHRYFAHDVPGVDHDKGFLQWVYKEQKRAVSYTMQPLQERRKGIGDPMIVEPSIPSAEAVAALMDLVAARPVALTGVPLDYGRDAFQAEPVVEMFENWAGQSCILSTPAPLSFPWTNEQEVDIVKDAIFRDGIFVLPHSAEAQRPFDVTPGAVVKVLELLTKDTLFHLPSFLHERND